MSFRSLMAIIGILILSAGFVAAQTPETEGLPPELVQDIEKAEKDWMDHLFSTPVIYKMEKDTSGKPITREEELRFHSMYLGNKGESNREWNEYWKGQGARCNSLIALYGKAIKALSEEDKTGKIKMYENRLVSAKKWHELTQNKTKNQDEYLKAIQAEKQAYDKRLAGHIKSGAKDEAEKDAGEKKKIDSPSPYRQHKEKITTLSEQLKYEKTLKAEAENDVALTEELIQAKKILAGAQKADLELGVEELTITEKQIKSAGADYAWKKNWQNIYNKVNDKLYKLDQVLKDQEESIVRIKAKKSYYEMMVSVNADRIQQTESQIALEKKNLIKAVALTAKDIIIKRGILVVAYILCGWLALVFVRRTTRYILRRADDGDDSVLSDREQRAETLTAVFSSIAKFAVFLVVGLLLLDAVGVNIGPLMGAFAIFGLAISFGSQNLVKDLVTGFFILLEDQLSVGDVVELGGTTGTVEKISLRRVVLRDVYGAVHSIPNSEISSVTNKTHGWGRAVVHVGIGYGDDLRHAWKVFDEVGSKMYEDPEWQSKLTEAPFVAGVTELGDSAVVLRVWAKTLAHEQWGIERELNLRLKEAADANGIEIPFPQTVVTMVKE